MHTDVSEASTLEARNIAVRFEGLTAVDAVNEIIHAGELVGLIGPNGAGKTTLVNAMTGFQVPSTAFAGVWKISITCS